MSKLPCYVVGSGNAANAMLAALAWASQTVAGVPPLKPERLKRGQALPEVSGPSLLLIANPHALHADLILEAAKKGFTHVVSEKPAVVSLEQIDALRNLPLEVAVCHGYRQNWGPQSVRKAIEKGDLGQLICIEGRYWQSSAAAHAVTQRALRENWKNDPRLSGPHDTLLDLGTHWADMVCFLVGSYPSRSRGWMSYVNAEAPHRDTHVQLELDFGSVRTWGSVSKTVHGAGNHLEVVAIGSKGLMKWSFERPDELVIAVGKESRTAFRSVEQPAPSGLSPNHALGWLEGYVSILQNTLRHLTGQPNQAVPTLADSLAIVEVLLKTDFVRQTPL